MSLRIFLFCATLCVSSVALAQQAGGSGVASPSREFNRAFRASDRDAVIEVAGGAVPIEVCVATMLRDQALREVHVPRGIRFTDFDRGILESAQGDILQRLPALETSIEGCLATLDSADAFVHDRERLVQRLADLRELRRALDEPVVFAAFPKMREHLREAEFDVSWRAIRARYSPPEEPGQESWRSTALVMSAVTVGVPALFVPLSVTNRDLNSASARLTAVGISLGSLGGLMVAGVWQDPTARSTKTRLTYGALWTLASLAGGIALLRADVPRRFQLMGVGLVVGGVLDTALWAGAVRISRQARRSGRTRFSLGRNGGALEWSGSF
ncbi:MAG: hypothetical protein ACI9KE_002780 [Polyangiales bacterium]